VIRPHVRAELDDPRLDDPRLDLALLHPVRRGGVRRRQVRLLQFINTAIYAIPFIAADSEAKTMPLAHYNATCYNATS
jgi:hypothetical protein